MNIESEKFKIEMNHEEMWATAWDIKNALLNTLRSHWVQHQDVWIQNEERRLYRLKLFFSHLGRLDLYEEIHSQATEIFRGYNEKNKDK